jgi:ribosomal protein S18 acetylase RimI-like enzyme
MITIRPAAEADAPVLQQITVTAYQHYVARIGREPAPMTADYAAAVRDGQAWIAEDDDGAAVGLLILIPHPDHLLLENIAVLPAAQGLGLGARLLAFVEERAAELGLPEIRLYTNEAMTENIAYYPRHGYTETHRAGQGGFRRVFFSKRLTGQ